LNAAAKETKERKAVKPKATFNQTNDSIEWAKWTWNPVTGCNHGCPYCYARDIAKRYPDAFPHGFKPTFIADRIDAPLNTKLPTRTDEGWRNVFVCSMADLFGDWVPQEWIDKVLASCAAAPEWNFIFLTKNPARLVGLNWPENACVGATVDCQKRVASTVKALRELSEQENRPFQIFISCEPLSEQLDFGITGLDPVDVVIIGARSAGGGLPAMQPEWKWVNRLICDADKSNCEPYWKPNLTVRPKAFLGRLS
jgi:protein gp37